MKSKSELKPLIEKFVTITKQLINAHREQSDDSSYYTDPLEELLETIADDSFYDEDPEHQSQIIAAIRGKYFGKAELFRIVVPQYLEYSFMDIFRKVYTDLIDALAAKENIFSISNKLENCPAKQNPPHEEAKIFQGSLMSKLRASGYPITQFRFELNGKTYTGRELADFYEEAERVKNAD